LGKEMAILTSRDKKIPSTEPVDLMGIPLQVGDKVARATAYGGSGASISICEITKIKDNKVYLDNSHVALHYPGLLLVVNKLF
jgi:hypothetical protein